MSSLHHPRRRGAKFMAVAEDIRERRNDFAGNRDSDASGTGVI